MQRKESETVDLDSVIITSELSRREPRQADFQTQAMAMQSLARQLAQRETMLQSLAQMALSLCHAGSAGVSMLTTTTNGEEVFRTHVLLGALTQDHVGGMTKRVESPYGICLDLGMPVLYSHPEHYFTYLQAANTPIVEELVLPVIADNHAIGTIWIMSHSGQRHFDSEDVRVMTSLADLTAVAFLLNQPQAQELCPLNAQPEALIGERQAANSNGLQAKADKSASDTLLSAGFIERNLAEKAWHESLEKYRTLFDSIDEGYCVIEMHIEPGEPLDYRFIATNQAFEKQSTLVNAQGKWMRDLRPNHEESWFEIYRDVALTGEPIRFEHGGRELGNRWFTLYAFRIGEPKERQVAVLFNDITERKQAEQAKTLFLSNVSHEFRTPLTLLLSPLQDVLSETPSESLRDHVNPLSPSQRERLELAHRNAVRLLKLVNTLLDFSRIETGYMEAVYEPTDLATLTTELASSFSSAIAQAGLRLVIDCPPLLQLVYVDRSWWENIVLNLLSNAFKFTFAGEITVRLKQAGNQVELTVQDTGIGIQAAELPRLFERFYQVKGASGRSFEGSGIGLSLVQELVKLHGGTISVSSTQGIGSCFTVSIPTVRDHLRVDRIGSPQPLTSRAISATGYVEEALGWLPKEGEREKGKRISLPQPQSPSPTARILFVDDNADMRDYVKRLLSQRAQVETAANGAIALELIAQQLPDLVLADVMMPELDGLQLLKALRADQETKSIPIILLSARAGVEATVSGLEAGADDYLIKPFSARELIARVETQLQMSQLRFEQSANRFKNEFLLTVTHELQAPLANILGWTRLLQSQHADSAKMARALAIIERNAKAEAKLVKDLLDVSGILLGKLQLQFQVVDLVSVLHEVVKTFHQTAIAKNIQLTLTISHVARCDVKADNDRLRQIIANLLENAIKFTDFGGKVSIGLEHFDLRVEITVTDTGCGISPNFLPVVFDRFSQAEVPSHHSPGGVGIGLAIARSLVELHSGTISVQSPGAGQGATFIVTLPLISS